MLNYIIACDKLWHVEYFTENRHRLRGSWSLATCTADLESQAMKLNPRFIFFPHWSTVVPARVFEKYDCVAFHMTDVPFGRGGSPLQNLILRGYSETIISALKMEKIIDAGPVYLQRGLELSGSALDIFRRSAPICFDMMRQIQDEEMLPIAQKGHPTPFKRRLPSESKVSETVSIEEMYNFIRMLDAPNYPSAFILHGDLKIEFSKACIDEGNVLYAQVKVVKHEQ